VRLISGSSVFGRKRPLGLALLGLVFSGAASLHCSQPEPAKSPERIILIVVDTLRRDHVSAYAADPVRAKTPNIDRLAATGMIFENAVSAFHATTMSMAALFTGRTPSIESESREHTIEWNTFAFGGMSRFSVPGKDDASVPQALDTLAEDLRAAGYWTLGVVANELLYRPAGYDQGFDQWVEVGLPAPGQKLNIFEAARLRTADDVNREVLAALERRPSDRFFLYVHYIDVHDWSLFRRSYEKSVERYDRQLGELLDQLAADGLLEGATVVFTSDHGEMLVEQHLNLKTSRHFGNPAFEPVLEIPLIVTPPIKADARAMIRSQDVRGMIGRIAGLDVRPAPDLEPDELFLTEMFYQTYRKGRWKSMWERTGDGHMLFDLVEDPHENVDLSKQRADILARHRERIDELSLALVSGRGQAPTLSDEQLERLRALGYIDTTTDEFRNREAIPERPGT